LVVDVGVVDVAIGRSWVDELKEDVGECVDEGAWCVDSDMNGAGAVVGVHGVV
jgi:hypothetical protein